MGCLRTTSAARGGFNGVSYGAASGSEGHHSTATFVLIGPSAALAESELQ